jgi:hypothetical protein
MRCSLNRLLPPSDDIGLLSPKSGWSTECSLMPELPEYTRRDILVKSFPHRFVNEYLTVPHMEEAEGQIPPSMPPNGSRSKHPTRTAEELLPDQRVPAK